MVVTKGKPMTEFAALAARFCDTLNADLSLERGQALLAEMKAAHPDLADAIAELDAALAAAFTPGPFFTDWVVDDGPRFEQAYELLRLTFNETELEPRGRYQHMVKQAADAAFDYPLVMAGNFWRTSGLCVYDEQSTLLKFDFDPLNFRASTHLRGLINSNYMRLPSAMINNASVGVIGHTAPYPPTAEGNLGALNAFEQRMTDLARQRGETLRLFMVEADAESADFFYEAGYREPKDSRYEQPPMEFDPETGMALNPPVPQTLMVKVHNPAFPNEVEVTLLKAAVQTMVEQWCLAEMDDFTPVARDRAKAQVDRVRLAFEASLPKTDRVELVKPNL